MSENITIELVADPTKARRTITDVSREIHQTEADLDALKREAERQRREILMLMSQALQAGQAVGQLIGGVTGYGINLMFSTINAAVTTVNAINAAMAATGVGAVFAGISATVALTSLVASIVKLVDLNRNYEEYKEQMAGFGQIQAIIRDVAGR